MSRKKLHKNEKLFEIGQRIKEVRENIPLSQKEFAKILNVKRGAPSIADWENGIVGPRITLFCNMSEMFNCDLHWVLTGKKLERGEPSVMVSGEIEIIERLRLNSRFREMVLDILKEGIKGLAMGNNRENIINKGG